MNRITLELIRKDTRLTRWDQQIHDFDYFKNWRALFERRSRNGSKSQFVPRDWGRCIETSSVVTKVKHQKLGGVKGDGNEESFEWRLLQRSSVRSLWNLSGKNVANDQGRAICARRLKEKDKRGRAMKNLVYIIPELTMIEQSRSNKSRVMDPFSFSDSSMMPTRSST